MGSSNSRRSRTITSMSTSSEPETDLLGAQGGSDCPPGTTNTSTRQRTGSDEEQQDLQAILAYLVRR